MERDLRDFERRDDARGDDEDDLDRVIADISPRERDEIAAAIEEARDDMAAGRVVPHELVSAWLETWGTPDFKPMPDEWLK